MIEHTYEVLEYHRLLSILSKHAACSLGRSDCLSLRPSRDATIIENELRRVSETRLLLKLQGFPPLSGVDDISAQLREARTEGSRLEPEQLLGVLRLADAYEQARKVLYSRCSLCPGLWDLLDQRPHMEGIVRELGAALDEHGSLKDNASPQLKKVREKKARLRLDLQKKLESIQRSKGIVSEGCDHLVTLREGRYVVPVRSDQKWRLEGIVHDFSQTRTTCFIEPLEVVGDNNRLAELFEEEREEERRVLARLTQMVRDAAPHLEDIQGAVAGLDGICARATFAESLSCVAPEIGTERSIHLKQAQNPILLAQAVAGGATRSQEGYPVPVDIFLGPQESLLIISGPNRGGKTVALKTLGLLSLMAQSGMHIPVEEGSYLPVSEEILAEIGDEQDLESGFSTFSAHATHLGEMVTRANSKSLVILDEPGMGTDPDEGAALAMAVLDHLSKKGAKVGVATHSNRLKTYGLLHEKAVNASVEFDDKSSRPTFRLNYGSPGISHALEIAKEMGVPSAVLEQAKSYLDRDEVQLNHLIERLNRSMAAADNARESSAAAERRYQKAQQELAERLKQLETGERELRDAMRAEAEELLSTARTEFKQLINQLKAGTKGVQAEATKRMDELGSDLMARFDKKREKAREIAAGSLKVGQSVYHKKLKQRGVVESVDPSSGTARVMVGTVKIAAPMTDLEQIQSEEAPVHPAARVSWTSPEDLPHELNVVGFRVDDALPLVERAMDAAYMKGDETVRIIHGFGTGRLKEAIRERLRRFSFVKEVHSADSSAGGEAITVVELM
jgi:DNA mismatch repair protein MutS2